MKKVFDYIVITVSSEEQKERIQKEIEIRKAEGIIASKTNYVIIQENERIGSGGAIFNVIRYFSSIKNFFEQNKVLLINSAGESTRIKMYSKIGKVCIPTFRQITEKVESIVFDEIIEETEQIGKNLSAGILVVSGDCTTKYNNFPKQCIKNNTAFCVKVKAEIGQRHGVFVEENGKLKETLQKKSVSELEEKATDKEGYVNIDTGMIYFNAKIIQKIETLIIANSKINEEEFKQIVNETVRLNFYTDFIYPLSKTANKQVYLKQKAEGEMNEQLVKVREKLWDILKDEELDILKIKDGQFIHFGTTDEFMEYAKKKKVDIETIAILGR